MNSILNSPLTSLNIHQIDLILPYTEITVPLLDSLTGSDVINLISSRGYRNFVVCRNSSRLTDFYDLLYCGNPPEPQLVNMMDKSLPPFLTTQISAYFQPSKILISKYQRMALFVFGYEYYFEMFIIRYNQKQLNSPFKMRSLFKKPPKSTFLVRLTTHLVIKVKMPLTSTVLELRNKVYENMCKTYPDSNISNINFFRLHSTIYDPANPRARRFPDPNKQLKDDNVILECLRYQKKYPNQCFLFVAICPPTSNFDRTIDELTKELDLCSIPMTGEIIMFNTDISILRSEISKNRIKMMQTNPLMAKMMISESEPVIPIKKIDDQYVIMKAELNTGSANDPSGSQSTLSNSLPQMSLMQSSVSSMAIAIKVNYDMTANQAIQMFLEKLRSMKRTARLSNEYQSSPTTSPFGTRPIAMPKANRPLSTSQYDRQSLALNQRALRQPPLIQQDQAPNPQTTMSKTPPPVPQQQKPQQSQEKVPPFSPQSSSNSSTQPPIQSNAGNDPNDFVITIGNDEVLAGNIPITHFVGVRHFIVSGQPILSVNLVDKAEIIKSIQEKETSQKASQKEITPEMTVRPIVITNYPTSQPNKDLGFVPHFKVKMYPQIEIHHAIYVNSPRDGYYFLRACLIYGTKLLCKPVQTKGVLGKSSLIFDETLVLPILLANIPREAQLSLTLYRDNSGGAIQVQQIQQVQIQSYQIEAVATCNSALYSFTGWFDSGPRSKKMWRGRDLDFFLTTCESNEENPIVISFSLPRYERPVFYIPPDIPDDFRSRATLTVPKSEKDRIELLREIDPLTPLTAEDKKALWKYRTFCFMYPELLSSMLDSIEYSDPDQVKEIPLLLANWKRPSGVQALSLLDVKYPNSYVRAYAVECLEELSDNEVLLYLLQLVQALKYELYEDSPLAQFLIRRGLTEPRVIGHQLFWQLMSEAHLSNIRMRFSLMIVNFMYGIGSYREELIKGFKFTQKLVQLNKELSELNVQDVQEPFREALQKIEIPKEFRLPVDSRLIVESFIIDKCKVMNSKKKPFFLVFKNAAPFATAPVMTMFKAGDDLRQDQLILQLMKIMEHLWRKEGLDFGMRCYSVLPTGLNQGFIEVVPNAITESELQVDKGTFNKQIYVKYLKKKNPTDQKYEEARRNFLLSSVGYAVATCVLGVTDRHPGNIMIQDDGHFFHVDFGHFLGNFKKFNGIQTEDAPFHFISSYVEILDGKKSIYFKTFLTSSADALNILRKNAKLLITLLVLMIGTGIPELQKLEDIQYFKDMLFLDSTEKEAGEKFKELTIRSLKSWKTYLKAKFHNEKEAKTSK